jgi:hypothetical protein
MPDRNAAGKVQIYFTIYRLNLSFSKIVGHCRALQESGVLTAKFTRLYQSYAQELQAEINEDVMSAMDEVESRDQFRFGKARLAREKELRDPDDVFIHAEERRRELARQGKKPPALKRRKPLRSQPGKAQSTKPSSSQPASQSLRR